MRGRANFKIPAGETRYIAPRVHVCRGGMATVTGCLRGRLQYKFEDGETNWTPAECWLNLPFVPPEPSPKLMAEWIDRQVVIVRGMTNGNAYFPAGTRFVVRGHHRGRLSLDPVIGKHGISGVHRHDVQLVPREQVLGRKARSKGFDGLGPSCDVLGPAIMCGGQWWVPVQWKGEEDPSMFKLSCLEPA